MKGKIHKMPLYQILERGTDVQIFVIPGFVSFGTIFKLLDESLQFQFVLHGFDLKNMEKWAMFNCHIHVHNLLKKLLKKHIPVALWTWKVLCNLAEINGNRVYVWFMDSLQAHQLDYNPKCKTWKFHYTNHQSLSIILDFNGLLKPWLSWKNLSLFKCTAGYRNRSIYMNSKCIRHACENGCTSKMAFRSKSSDDNEMKKWRRLRGI